MSYDNIYEKLKNKLKKNKLMNNTILLDYMRKRIQEEDIDDYITSLNIGEDDSSYYDPNTGSFYLNKNEITLNNIDSEVPDLGNSLKNKDIDYNFVNIYNIFTINHEINHVIQKKCRNEDDNTLKRDLFILGQILIYIDYTYLNLQYTNKYHDKFLNEYNSHIESYLETIGLFHAYDLPILKNHLIELNKIASKHILFMYSDIDNNKLSNPIRNSFKLYKRMLKKCEEDEIELDFYISNLDEIEKEKPNSELEKLRLGFSVSEDTLNFLKNISNNKIKTLNLFEDIPR